MFQCDNSGEHTKFTLTCNYSDILVQDKHLRSGKSIFVYVSLSLAPPFDHT